MMRLVIDVEGVGAADVVKLLDAAREACPDVSIEVIQRHVDSPLRLTLDGSLYAMGRKVP